MLSIKYNRTKNLTTRESCVKLLNMVLEFDEKLLSNVIEQIEKRTID